MKYDWLTDETRDPMINSDLEQISNSPFQTIPQAIKNYHLKLQTDQIKGAF